MHPPVKQRDRQRRRFCRVEIGRHAGKGDGVQPLGKACIIGHDEPAGRAAEALVGAHRHKMGALIERIFPRPAGDDPALMRGVEEQMRSHLVGDRPHLAHRVLTEVEACAQGDQPGPRGQRQRTQPLDIDGIAVGVDRGLEDMQAVEPGAARPVMRHMSTDAGGRCDDRVAGAARGHEAVKIGDGPRGHADLGVERIKDFGCQFRRDHLDFLDRLEPHLVFVAGIAE